MEVGFFKGQVDYPALIIVIAGWNLTVSAGRILRRAPMQPDYYQSVVYISIGKVGLRVQCPLFSFRLWLFGFWVRGHESRDTDEPSSYGFRTTVIIEGVSVEGQDVNNVHWKQPEDGEGYWIGDLKYNDTTIHPILMPNNEWRVGR